MSQIFEISMIGIFATVVIDLWATFSNKILKFPRTSWAMVGRWLGHIQNGKLVHRQTGNASEINHENIIGWVFHYFIGITYAFLYIVGVTVLLDGAPTFVSAWLFGLLTILSPWLILQPCLGFGLCATKAPKPHMVRLQNLVIHSIFGTALYLGWLLSTKL